MTQEDLTLPEGFASPTGKTAKYKNLKLKPADDEIEIRILPAMKSLLAVNDFGMYWALHFGWNGQNPNNPSKIQYRPFLCIEERGFGGMITQKCPACSYMAPFIEKNKAAKANITAQVEALRARGKAAGAPAASIDAEVKKLQDKLFDEAKANYERCRSHNRDGKMRIPCLTRQGEFAIFAAPYGVVQQLRKLIKELKARNYPGTQFPIEAAGRKGVWFKITRSGKASQTSDSVSVSQIIRTDGSAILDFHTISNEQLKQAFECLPDLAEFRDSSRLREDQMEALIALDKLGNGSPDPVEVDKIWGKKTQQPTTDTKSWANTAEPQKQEPAAQPESQSNDWATAAEDSKPAEQKPAEKTKEATPPTETKPAETLPAVEEASEGVPDASWEEMWNQ